MMIFWTVIVFLGILLVIDVLIAYRSYKKDKKPWEFAIHIALLVMLGILIMNLTLASFNLGMEIPFIFTEL